MTEPKTRELDKAIAAILGLADRAWSYRVGVVRGPRCPDYSTSYGPWTSVMVEWLCQGGVLAIEHTHRGEWQVGVMQRDEHACGRVQWLAFATEASVPEALASVMILIADELHSGAPDAGETWLEANDRD